MEAGAPLVSPEAGASCTGLGLDCRRPACGGGATTSIEGDVYDPARKNKLYDVLVYVPNDTLMPLTDGPVCERCGAKPSGSPLAIALTDENGHFKLENVPAGEKIPLVVQVGKWQRTVTIPVVTACQNNVLTDKTVSLPRNQTEGHLPKLAVLLTGYDNLPCVLRNIGVDASEMTTPDGPGRLHLYAGEAPAHADTGVTPDGSSLWGAPAADGGAAKPAKFMDYDALIMTCEGAEYLAEDPQGGDLLKSEDARNAMKDYVNAGGRVFAEHYQYTWFKHNSDTALASVASWHEPPQSTYGMLTLDVNQSFPKGVAFGKWLSNVGASTTPGKLDVTNPSYNLDGATSGVSQAWLANGTSSYPYMTFNTPVGASADQQCGRVALTDIEVSGEPSGDVGYPSSCVDHALSPQEKAFEFFFFDLAACVNPDDVMPAPPSIK